MSATRATMAPKPGVPSSVATVVTAVVVVRGVVIRGVVIRGAVVRGVVVRGDVIRRRHPSVVVRDVVVRHHRRPSSPSSTGSSTASDDTVDGVLAVEGSLTERSFEGVVHSLTAQVGGRFERTISVDRDFVVNMRQARRRVVGRAFLMRTLRAGRDVRRAAPSWRSSSSAGRLDRHRRRSRRSGRLPASSTLNVAFAVS